MRTVASQMKDAVGQSVSVRIGGAAATGEDVVFSASGRVITFHGFLKAYVEGTDDDGAKDDAETRLPALVEGDAVSAASITANGHETKPPSRYTEATLIKELEEREIGRPSTYASIIGTILNRGYVYKKGTALVPAWLAFSVVRLLEEHFPRQVSYEFTALMEDVLDAIAAGEKDRVTELAEFYYGTDDIAGLHTLVTELGEIDARELATFPVGGPDSGINLRVGRYGPYLEGPDDEGNPAAKRANVPEDLPPDELTLEKAAELFANPAGEEIELGVHPETGLQVVAKNGRYGPYVTELLPEDAPKKDKPRTGSLFKSMSLDTITLADAVKLLSLPRVVGEDAEGVEITAQNGRYGPYLKKGTDSRSLTTEDQLFTVTLDEALAIYAQPKQRGRAAAAPPLKELGNDPVSGQPVVVKSGRFGEYVTDGEYNATLRKDDSVEADHPRARRRAAGRAPRARSGQEGREEGRQEGPGEEDGGQEDRGQEDAREEDGGQEDGGQEDRGEEVLTGVYADTGVFVCFEGGEGSGKSTQSRLLGDWLGEQGHDVVLTFEPGDTPVGQELRRIVLSPETGELSDRTETLLYAADKAEHVHALVRPALDRGAVVITDRYVDSTLAYQGAGRPLEVDEVERVARWATGDLRPHLTVVLDLDPATGLRRFAGRDRIEQEGLAFHERVRAAFLRMAAADPDHYLVLDARGAVDDLAAAVRARLAPLLPDPRRPVGCRGRRLG